MANPGHISIGVAIRALRRKDRLRRTGNPDPDFQRDFIWDPHNSADMLDCRGDVRVFS